MKTLKPISAQEMIGEFLRAELYSSRFREGSIKALSMLGYDYELLDSPDYGNMVENEQRAKVLGLTRGWPDQELFTHFPHDIEWFLASISYIELSETYRLKRTPTMTDDQRLLSSTSDGLKNGLPIQNVDSSLIFEIVERIKKHEILPPIILVTKDFSSKKVLIEGHSRSIAYVVAGEGYSKDSIPVIVGISSRVEEWEYF